MNQVLEAMKKRSSARAYSKEKLTQQELDTVLQAGLMAPTGMNRQELHFTVVSGEEAILTELDADVRGRQQMRPLIFHYDAPTLILITAENDFKWSKVDAGIAVQNMALAAESIGLGSVIIGCIYDTMNGEKKEYYAEKFRIPEGYSFEIGIAIGHKTDDKTPHAYDYDKQVTIL